MRKLPVVRLAHWQLRSAAALAFIGRRCGDRVS
jgi:hypothetical protein